MKLSILERLYSKNAVKGFKEFKKAKKLEHDGIYNTQNYKEMRFSDNPFYKANQAYTDAYNYFMMAKSKANKENNAKMKASYDKKMVSCMVGIKKTEGLFQLTDYSNEYIEK